MAKIKHVERLTDTPYVSLYHINGETKTGKESNYYLASRAGSVENLKLNTKQNNADGVVIYALYGEKRDKVVLVRQYRYAIDGYIYELPAGLVDEGENFREAAVRELHEETGLTLHPIDVNPMLEEPRYTTIGLTDEACGTVYGYATGEISQKFMEDSEEIEVVLADRDEVRRILKEEKVAIICAYQLMHFLVDEEPFAFTNVK